MLCNHFTTTTLRLSSAVGSSFLFEEDNNLSYTLHCKNYVRFSRSFCFYLEYTNIRRMVEDGRTCVRVRV